MLFHHKLPKEFGKEKYIVYELTEDCVKAHPIITKEQDNLVSFYQWLRETMGIDETDVMDCTKINIAENIQTTWIEYAKECGFDSHEITMTLLLYAPRVSKSLKNNEIRIFSDFIKKE